MKKVGEKIKEKYQEEKKSYKEQMKKIYEEGIQKIDEENEKQQQNQEETAKMTLESRDLEDKTITFHHVLWEYKTLYLKTVTNDRTIQDKLNKLGNEGWELVSIVFESQQPGCLIHTFFFKRPVKKNISFQ